MNLSRTTAYLGGFYSMLAGAIVWSSLQFILILLLTSKTKTVYGWTRDELIILTAAYTFFWGIFHFIFARNFGRLSRVIDYGELDTILVKPIDSQFSLSLWIINFAGIFRILLGTAVLIYMLIITHTGVSAINIIGFLVLGLFGLVLIYSFWFIVATTLIWYPRLSNLIDLLYNVSSVSKFPPQMVYEIKNYFLFFLVPLTFIMATPTKVLLHKVLLGDISGLLFFSVLIFLISRWFWKFALRYYTSASG